MGLAFLIFKMVEPIIVGLSKNSPGKFLYMVFDNVNILIVFIID